MGWEIERSCWAEGGGGGGGGGGGFERGVKGGGVYGAGVNEGSVEAVEEGAAGRLPPSF